jgi:hypothetical protein
MESAIVAVQRHGSPEGANHPPHNPHERWAVIAKWRLSVATQLMTPAPDTRAIAWKKAALDGGEWEYTDLTRERIERAIDDDEAFLAAHPMRQSIRRKQS